MTYTVIYDGNCNLCVTLVQLLEAFDQGQQFRYSPMQDLETLERFGVTAQDCELGMILIDPDTPQQRWQGAAAAEEIGRLLPLGNGFVAAYRALPGLNGLGNQIYAQVRDNRYAWFGQRDSTYRSAYSGCDSGACEPSPSPTATTQTP